MQNDDVMGLLMSPRGSRAAPVLLSVPGRHPRDAAYVARVVARQDAPSPKKTDWGKIMGQLAFTALPVTAGALIGHYAYPEVGALRGAAAGVGAGAGAFAGVATTFSFDRDVVTLAGPLVGSIGGGAAAGVLAGSDRDARSDGATVGALAGLLTGTVFAAILAQPFRI